MLTMPASAVPGNRSCSTPTLSRVALTVRRKVTNIKSSVPARACN